MWCPLGFGYIRGRINSFLFQPPAVSWNRYLCHRLIHLSTRNGSIHGWRGQLQGSQRVGQVTEPGLGHMEKRKQHSCPSGFWTSVLLPKGRISLRKEQKGPLKNEMGNQFSIKRKYWTSLENCRLSLPLLTVDASWSHQYPVWQQYVGKTCRWPWKPGPVSCVDRSSLDASGLDYHRQAERPPTCCPPVLVYVTMKPIEWPPGQLGKSVTASHPILSDSDQHPLEVQ